MRERERKIIVALVRDRPLAYAFDIRLLDQRKRERKLKRDKDRDRE